MNQLASDKLNTIRKSIRHQFIQNYFNKMRNQALEQYHRTQMSSQQIDYLLAQFPSTVFDIESKLIVSQTQLIFKLSKLHGNWLMRSSSINSFQQWSVCIQLLIKIINLSNNAQDKLLLLQNCFPLLDIAQRLVSVNKIIKYDILTLILDLYIQAYQLISYLDTKYIQRLVGIMIQLFKLDSKKATVLIKAVFIIYSITDAQINGRGMLNFAQLICDKKIIMQLSNLLQKVYNNQLSEILVHLIQIILTTLINITSTLNSCFFANQLNLTSLIHFISFIFNSPHINPTHINECFLLFIYNIRQINTPAYLKIRGEVNSQKLQFVINSLRNQNQSINIQ